MTGPLSSGPPQWRALRAASGAELAGLIVEGDPALGRDWAGLSRRDRAFAQEKALDDALDAAAAGRRPRRTVDRLPAWAVATCQRLLSAAARSRQWGAAFRTVRVLELAGLLDLPVDDDYVLAAVGELTQPSWGGQRGWATLADTWFTLDPGLVDRVLWRFFEVEGGGEISLANADKYAKAGMRGWREVFVDLVAGGTLDRDRVLDACLAALGRGFSAYRAQWYSALFTALDPTVDELAARQPALRRLLGASVPAIVTFAVKALATVQRAGRLDAADTASALVSAAGAPAKATALIVLRLVTGVAREPGADVAPALTELLAHPHPDVQVAAARLAVQLGLTALVDAEALEPTARAALGLTVTADPPSAATAQLAAPAVVEIPAVRPVTADDLAERAASVLEDRDHDPLELELVLDGLSRVDPGLLAPLRKRAMALRTRSTQEAPYADHAWLVGALAGVIAGVPVTAKWPPARVPAVAHLAARLAQVHRRVVGAAPAGGLLATPDDPRGYVTGATLAARVGASDGSDLDQHDLVAALLRLAPEGRDEVRHTASGGLAAVLDHALGRGSGVVPRGAAEHLWVAASRARMPLADDPALLAAGLQGAGRSEALRLTVQYRVAAEWSTDGRTYRSWRTEVSADHPSHRPRMALDRSAEHLEPTRLVDAARAADPGSLTCLLPWLGAIWPHDAEHVAATGLPHAGHWGMEVNPAIDALLRALQRHPGRVGVASLSALVVGLGGSSSGTRATAVDLSLSWWRAGRVDAAALGAALADAAEPAVLTRFAGSLRAMADLGEASLVIDVLTAALPSVPQSAPGLSSLVEVLHAEVLLSGRPVTDAALRAWLAGFTGSGRAAKAARALVG